MRPLTAAPGSKAASGACTAAHVVCEAGGGGLKLGISSVVANQSLASHHGPGSLLWPRPRFAPLQGPGGVAVRGSALHAPSGVGAFAVMPLDKELSGALAEVGGEMGLGAEGGGARHTV